MRYQMAFPFGQKRLFSSIFKKRVLLCRSTWSISSCFRASWGGFFEDEGCSCSTYAGIKRLFFCDPRCSQLASTHDQIIAVRLWHKTTFVKVILSYNQAT